jgi:MFS family permease
VDWSDEESLHNFVDQFNFHCDIKSFGFFGALFILGLVLGCVTLTRMGDIYGRKPLFMLGLGIQVIIIYWILFSHSNTVLFFLTLLMGWATSAR